MKRVLLLVCLIVSVVQLDWEREQIYVWSSGASLLLIFYGELMRRRNAQRTAKEGVLQRGNDRVASNPEGRVHHWDDRPQGTAIQEIALMQNNSG